MAKPDDEGMTSRRYHDDEVRKILEVAARREHSMSPAETPADGLTLAEIQGIAREVGLSPAAVAQAAAALDVTAGEPRTSWGMPIEVRRIVPLPRALADDEWERLVAELRSTFRARGRVAVQGNLREWSNGNLHVCVEPAAEGYRLRMGTLKGDAEGVNALGLTGMVAGAVVAGATALTGGEPHIAGSLILGLAGGGAIIGNMVRLPRWARTRDQQLARVGGRTLAMLEPTPIASDPD